MLERCRRRLIAVALSAALLPLAPAPGYPQAPAPQPGAEKPAAAGETPEVQPKFIWGVLILKFVAGEVFSNFAQWTYGKITGKPVEGTTMLASAVDYLRGKGDTTGGGDTNNFSPWNSFSRGAFSRVKTLR